MRIGGLALVLGMVSGSGAASAQEQESCGRYPVPEASYSCTCGTVNVTAGVWGEGPYTSDSDLCAAALHAGVIGPGGGAVTARLADGQDSYGNSEANGVRTSRWGRYDSSFAFDPLEPAGVPDFGVADTPQTVSAPGEVAVCAGVDYGNVETVCRCEPGQSPESATVWGSSPYVAGSDLCAAARHSEVIGLDGGVISVIRLPGLTSYRGSERGGVRSQDWGEYEESFVVNAN